MFVEFEPDEVRRRWSNNCVFQKGPLPQGQVPVGSGTSSEADDHFFHVCPYCSRCDACNCEDGAQDHMEKSHNYYKNIAKFERTFQRQSHIKRKTLRVLARLIKNERALLNPYTLRLYAAEASVAFIQRRQIAPPVPVDEQAGILHPVERNRAALTAILIAERRALKGRDWKGDIRRAKDQAWTEARKNGFEEFDWDIVGS